MPLSHKLNGYLRIPVLFLHKELFRNNPATGNFIHTKFFVGHSPPSFHRHIDMHGQGK